MPLTGFFRGYCRLLLDLRVAELYRRNDYFSPYFVSKMYGTPSLHAICYVIDKKHFVYIRASLCVVLLVPTYFEAYWAGNKIYIINILTVLNFHLMKLIFLF